MSIFNWQYTRKDLWQTLVCVVFKTPTTRWQCCDLSSAICLHIKWDRRVSISKPSWLKLVINCFVYSILINWITPLVSWYKLLTASSYSSGLLATVPSSSSGNGNSETPSDVMGFPVEATPSAAAASSKWHKTSSPLSLQTFLKASSVTCHTQFISTMKS